MNIKEFVLDEIELHAALIDEGVSALLHTILFVRAPNLVKPEDYICKRLAPLSFAKCGPSDVDQTVSDGIATLEKVRVQIGPHRSKGVLIVTFYEKRESKAFFGFMSNEEKVCFERWRIPVVVDERPLPRKSSVGREVGDATDRLHHEIDLEKQRLCDMARLQTQQRILSILEIVNKSIDHVPPSMYQYEIEATGPAGERKEQSIVAKLINTY